MLHIQHGFLRDRSTVSNLLQCTDPWTSKIIKLNTVDMMYLDFKRAFEKMPHERLTHKLHCFSVRDPLLSFIRDFLSGRISIVRMRDQISEQFSVINGAPQGSVMDLFYSTYLLVT